MPAVTETYSLGVPVEVGKIDQKLKKLWQESEGAVTRASPMNLAVYSDEPGSLDRKPQLWTWVDRVIYDSRPWQDFQTQMRLVESAQAEAKQRIVLCDLNWTRLDKVRFALAQFFDHPASHHRLDKISKLRIDFARGFRSTALLFVGWLAAQLNWRAEKTNGKNKLQFISSSGRKIDIEIRQRDGQPIHEVALTAADIEFVVTHAKCGDLLEVSRGKP